MVQKYFFLVSGPGQLHDDDVGTPLPSHDAARAYAERIIRELTEAGGYDDPRLKMIVQNAQRQTIFTIPFTAGAAAAINGERDHRQNPFQKRD